MSHSEIRRCCNCGARRDDLIEYEGRLWCPGYGDCDRTLYNEVLARDIEESELMRAKREALREQVASARRALAATYPPRFRCPYCDAVHGERYGEGRNPDCAHRGDHFEEHP